MACNKTDGGRATSAGVSSPGSWGEKERCPGTWSRLKIIPTAYSNNDRCFNSTATTLRRGVVLPCAPRNARWPIATHHPAVSLPSG